MHSLVTLLSTHKLNVSLPRWSMLHWGQTGNLEWTAAFAVLAAWLQL